MNEAEKARIYKECDEFRVGLLCGAEQTPEAALYVATCLLMQVQHIHRAVGGPTLDAAILYHFADKSAGEVKGK